ncbi:MAG: hypothetical protein WCF23_04440, partial [Candidatus Nitrosopolaris sp.]
LRFKRNIKNLGCKRKVTIDTKPMVGPLIQRTRNVLRIETLEGKSSQSDDSSGKTWLMMEDAEEISGIK